MYDIFTRAERRERKRKKRRMHTESGRSVKLWVQLMMRKAIKIRLHDRKCNAPET